MVSTLVTASFLSGERQDSVVDVRTPLPILRDLMVSKRCPELVRLRWSLVETTGQVPPPSPRDSHSARGPERRTRERFLCDANMS